MVQLAAQLVSCTIASESSASDKNRHCSVRDVLSLPSTEFLSVAFARLTSPEVGLDIVKG